MVKIRIYRRCIRQRAKMPFRKKNKVACFWMVIFALTLTIYFDPSITRPKQRNLFQNWTEWNGRKWINCPCIFNPFLFSFCLLDVLLIYYFWIFVLERCNTCFSIPFLFTPLCSVLFYSEIRCFGQDKHKTEAKQ